jgi:hypothetical protein
MYYSGCRLFLAVAGLLAIGSTFAVAGKWRFFNAIAFNPPFADPARHPARAAGLDDLSQMDTPGASAATPSAEVNPAEER